jgi:hypothetical protein
MGELLSQQCWLLHVAKRRIKLMYQLFLTPFKVYKTQLGAATVWHIVPTLSDRLYLRSLTSVAEPLC